MPAVGAFLAAASWVVLAGCGPAPPEPAFPTPAEGSAGATLRFAVLGHLYPIAEPEPLRALLGAVEREMPEMVFVLGDSGLEEPWVVRLIEEELGAKVYFVPGNHELEGDGRDRYLENVGYLDRFVATDACNFILLNSSASLDEILAFLDRALEQARPELPTVLLTHHRIWDDTLLSPRPYGHDKSYYFGELYPALRGHVDYMFAGNSRRQYFRDLSDSPNYGPQNLNNVYWADQVGEITAYSVGMGDGVPKASFVIVDVVDGRLLLIPRAVTWSGRDLVDPRLIDPVGRSRPPNRPPPP
jgi:hypothetical protein